MFTSLTGLVAQRRRLQSGGTYWAVAVCDYPAFRPEVTGRGGDELVQLALIDRGAVPEFVQLPGFALDCDMLSVAAANCDHIYAYVLLGGLRELRFPLRPFRPLIATFDVPIFDDWANLNSEVLKPRAIGALWTHLGYRLERRYDYIMFVALLHRCSPNPGDTVS